MNIQVIEQNQLQVAVVESPQPLITDVGSALDLMMSVKYETGCTRIALEKTAVAEDFFMLSTCLAGEVLQKFINYQMKLAIFGDFSHYTSKPLRDFMYESNRGKDVFFVANQEEAVSKLCGQ